MYWSSSRYVATAQKRFGAKWFRKKIVSNREAALAKEIRLHAYFDVRRHPLFFNRANQTSISFKPPGHAPSREIREKISHSMKGNTNFAGKSHSRATREKISQSMKGKQNTLNYKHSDETREKMRETRRTKQANTVI